MIEKLDLRENVEIIPIKGSCHDYCLAKSSVLIKINELVEFCNDIGNARSFLERHEEQITKLNDAVNVLQAQVAILEEHAHPTAKTEPADPYAEQRKWIGKLCRFWNFKDGAIDIGILKAVNNLKPTIPYINDIDCSYAYCEPVKPDDDIIYKGGDND